jgi:hypothetical protein
MPKDTINPAPQVEVAALEAFHELANNPAYVELSAGKKPIHKGHMDRRPDLRKVIKHISSGKALGVRPFSVGDGFAVLDCDDSAGIDAAKRWLRTHQLVDALLAVVPSSSGLAHKFHIWLACDYGGELPPAGANGNFELIDPISEELVAGGQLRTSVHTKVTTSMVECLAFALAIEEPKPVHITKLLSLKTASVSKPIDPDFDQFSGCDFGEEEADYCSEQIESSVNRSDTIWHLVHRLKERGISFASSVEGLEEFTCGWPKPDTGEADEKYEGVELEKQVYAIWEKAPVYRDPSEDFDDDQITEADGCNLTSRRKPSKGAERNFIGPLAKLNRQYCAVDLEGRFKVAYTRTETDGQDGRSRTRWVFASRQSFEDLHMNRLIEIGGEDKSRIKPLGKAWLEWKDRAQAKGIVFDPSTDDRIANGLLNLWTGFSCKPVEGDWSEVRWLIEVSLCDGDAEASNYVLDWIAWKIQNPDELPGVALAFKGAKGTGKTTLGELVASLFGSHGLVLSRREQLTGQFTSYLGTACFVLCDEVDFRHASGKEDGQLKKLVTDRASMIERKGVDAVASTNRLGVMLATNADVVVPASADERRYAVFEVADTWATGDGAPNREEARRRHALVHTQIKNGGREAFLHAMLNRNVDVHPREGIPANAALASQKIESLPLTHRWLLSACNEGELPQSDFDENNWDEGPVFTTSADVIDGIMRLAREEGVRPKKPSPKAVMGQLKPFGIEPTKYKQERAWMFPPLAEIRQSWINYLGVDPFE